LYIPTNPSYTKPILVYDDAGLITYLVLIAISFNSIYDNAVYGTNKFISSPSKSALYGVVIATFN